MKVHREEPLVVKHSMMFFFMKKIKLGINSKLTCF